MPSPAVAAIVRLSPSSCDEKAGREKVVCSSIVFAAVINFHLALVTGAKRMMAGEMCIAYGFVVALNVDDARRGIGTVAKFAERSMSKEPSVKCAHGFLASFNPN